MPWRETRDPYRILVSEVMLQQTGVERVLSKYSGFLESFPDFAALAEAPLRSVLAAWQGLGYNRRTVTLRGCAKAVMSDHGGVLPSRLEELTSLPGIGPATASGILAFAFGEPAAFVETNVRRVFLHFFFPGRTRVKDSEILPLVELTMDRANPREWYYALMDYGARLGKSHPGLRERSAHRRSQPRFEGSDRQVRGKILKVLLAEKGLTEAELAQRIGVAVPRLSRIVARLREEGFLNRKGAKVSIA